MFYKTRVNLKKKLIGRKRKIRCAYCGNLEGTLIKSPKRMIGKLRITMDHIVPKKHGGTNDIRNLILACQVCNLIKADMVFMTLKGARKGIMRGWALRGYEVANKEAHEKE